MLLYLPTQIHFLIEGEHDMANGSKLANSLEKQLSCGKAVRLETAVHLVPDGVKEIIFPVFFIF